jgi:hypothetical protein
MQFSRIINQQEVKQQLVELIQHNRLSHALLFLSKKEAELYRWRGLGAVFNM